MSKKTKKKTKKKARKKTRRKRINSREKGCKGEREWAKWLRDTLGLTDARRGQQFKGTPDSPDVVGGIPGTHPEVKRVEALNLAAAMKKAVEDAGDDVPYVAHRRNRTEWLITIRAADLVRLCECVAAGAGKPIYPPCDDSIPDFNGDGDG